MKLTIQIAIIFIICLIGQIISNILPFTMPSSIISMILLFLLLLFKAIKVENIKTISDFLLKNMAFFFIPAGVGLLESFPSFKDSIVPLLIVCIINTFLTFIVTAFTVIGVIKLQKKWEKRKG